MSGLFSRPPRPKKIIPPEPIEDIAIVEEEAEEAKRREKKKLLTRGRQATILSGITAALKKRLGE